MWRMNPVYLRELYQNSRMKKTAVLLSVFNGVLSLFGLLAFYLTFEDAQKIGNSVNYSDILTIYGIITGAQFLLVLFIIPGISSGTISGEREKQTLDILLSTRMTPFQIIKGKLLASLSLMLLLGISSLPITALVFAVGGITFPQLLQFQLFLIVTSVYLGSIGIFFSSLCKRTTLSTVCAYTTGFIITIGLAMLLLGGHLLDSLGSMRHQVVYGINKMSGMAEVNVTIATLLFDPIFTFFSMLKSQIGIEAGAFTEWRSYSRVTKYLINHWFTISIFVQSVVSILLLVASSWLITPVKKRKRTR